MSQKNTSENWRGSESWLCVHVCTCTGGVFDISKKQNMSNKNQKLGHFKRVLLEFLKLLDLYFMYTTQVPRLVSKNAEAWGRKGGAGRSGLQEISIWSLYDLIFLSGLQDWSHWYCNLWKKLEKSLWPVRAYVDPFTLLRAEEKGELIHMFRGFNRHSHWKVHERFY